MALYLLQRALSFSRSDGSFHKGTSACREKDKTKFVELIKVHKIPNS